MGDVGSAFFGGFFGGDPGANLVETIGGKEDIFGQRPEVAPYVPIDLTDETSKALASNLENLPEITALLDKYIPGFSDMLSQGTSNTLSELKGEIPADVQAQIQRSSAYRSLMGGFSGTGMSKALTARDLGRTSLDLTTMGNNSAQIWSQLAEQAYSPFTISTGQQVSTTAANNAGIQANQQFQFNVDAGPDPGVAGIFALDNQIGQQFLSFGLGAAGGAIAGGGTGGAPAQTSANTLPGTGGYTYDPSIASYVPANSSGDWRSNATWSDRRLKENIRKVGVSPAGWNIYHYNHKGATTIFEGVIADEIEKVLPEAVYDGGDGYKRVNYNLLDVEFSIVEPTLDFGRAA